MTIYTRPDATIPVWAESGDKVQPSNAEVQTGWPLSTVPPSRQRFNWILGETAEAVRYLLQRGIPEWSAAEDYPIGARVQLADVVYTAVAANTGVTPGTSPANWILGASAVSQTPPQFDNDTSIATTAFVQRALGNLRAETAGNSSTTLDTVAIGQLIVGGTGTYTTTLPLASTCPVGSQITFFGTAGISTWLVQRQGADIIENNAGATFFSIGPGDSAVLESNGVGTWRIVNGSIALRNARVYQASLTANGYQRLPSGLILQWGIATTSGATPGSVAVNFPIAFPNEIYAINCTRVDIATSSASTISNVSGRSLPGFTIWSSAPSAVVNWTAVGR